MVRQKTTEPPDTWVVTGRADGTWLGRPAAPGWVQEHRVVGGPAGTRIAETRLRPANPDVIPFGGIDSALLRSLTLRGVRDAADGPGLSRTDDLGPLERSMGGEDRDLARRFRLAVTATAYIAFLHAGSRRPNVEVARVLGVPPATVRDRLHRARMTDPPLLTGGGRRGVVGEPVMTGDGQVQLDDILSRVLAAMGDERRNSLNFDGDVWELLVLVASLAAEAESRVPAMWQLPIAEVARLGAVDPPAWVVAHNAGAYLLLGPSGPEVGFDTDDDDDEADQ